MTRPTTPSPEVQPAAHVHEWEVEYLPDPMSGGGVVRSGDLVCRCGDTIPDAPTLPRQAPPREPDIDPGPGLQLDADDDWAGSSYDDKTIAEIVHDFAVTRGDLSEQYARDQLVAVIQRRMVLAQAEALQDAADAVYSTTNPPQLRSLWAKICWYATPEPALAGDRFASWLRQRADRLTTHTTPVTTQQTGS